jgi:hypothetical protein
MANPEDTLTIARGRALPDGQLEPVVADVRVAGGVVAAVAPDLDPSGTTVLDATGCLVLPAVIDVHVHLTEWLGCEHGFGWLAAAGVAVAVDASGPVEQVRRQAERARVGITVGSLQVVSPGMFGLAENPTAGGLDTYLSAARDAGASGVKLMGGHFPLAPELIAQVVGVCQDNGLWLVCHAGSARTASDPTGVAEFVGILAGRPAHLAHVNSYCRRDTADAEDPVPLTLDTIEAHPNLTSDSYLHQFNGVPAAADGAGRLRSRIAAHDLRRRGYSPDLAGLRRAVAAGDCWVVTPWDLDTGLRTGEAGMATLDSLGEQCIISFPVNDMDALLRIAGRRRPSGGFLVGALASDGGGIPRNVSLRESLRLVRAGVWGWRDAVEKLSRQPARLLGADDLGHFTAGRRADLVVVEASEPYAVRHLVVAGVPSIVAGAVLPRDTVFRTFAHR